MGELVQIALALAQVVGVVVVFAANRSATKNAALVNAAISYRKDLIVMLERIRFSKDGILSVFERIAEGGEVRQSDFKIVQDYSAAEFEVYNILGRVLNDYETNEVQISAENRELLGWLRDGKTSIRSRLKFYLGVVTMGREPNVDQFIILVEEIHFFNSIIDKQLGELRAMQPDRLT